MQADSQAVNAAILNNRPQNMPTALEIATQVQALNPDKRIGYTTDDYNVGVWSEEAGRFVRVFASTIMGSWVQMPYELLVNGKLPEQVWIELNPKEN